MTKRAGISGNAKAIYRITVYHTPRSRKGDLYTVKVWDMDNQSSGIAANTNPAQAFRDAETEACGKDIIGFIISDDPANWDEPG